MPVIHDPIYVTAGAGIPPLSTLLGSQVSGDIFRSLDDKGFTSFFGEQFEHMHRDFFNTHIRPMQMLNNELTRTVNLVMNPDTFRILNTIQDFMSIPPCMELPIILFEPVRKAFEEGRVEGFGFNPENLPEDFYGRIIDNFTCEDVASASDDDGYYDISGTMWSDDPDLGDDDIYAIRTTREYILNHIFAKTDRDPTAIDVSRG